MVIVKLMGGLGNQMFQYAAGRSLALARDVALKMDLSWLVSGQTMWTVMIETQSPILASQYTPV